MTDVAADPTPDPSEPAPDETPAEPVPEEVEAAETDPAGPLAGVNRPNPTTIDSSIQQGNRVVTQAQVAPENPVHALEEKIRSHFDAVTPLVAEVRRAADELEAYLNKLRVGLN